mgnify:CR=1 FL=1
MEDKLQIIPSQDPKSLYLYGLGQAIKELSTIPDGRFLITESDSEKKTEMINDIHKKALEVLASETNQ